MKLKELIQFDSEEIFLALSELVRVKGKEQEKEDFLLYDGGRFSIKSGEKE